MFLGYFDCERVRSEGDLVGVELSFCIAGAFCLYRQAWHHGGDVHVGVAREQNSMLLTLDPCVVGDIHNDDLTRFLVADAQQFSITRQNRPRDFRFVARCEMACRVCGCVGEACEQDGRARTKQHTQFPLTNIRFHSNSSKVGILLTLSGTSAEHTSPSTVRCSFSLYGILIGSFAPHRRRMQDSCQSANCLRCRQVIKIEAVQSATGETQRSVRVIIWTCVSQWSFRDSVSEGVQVQSTIDDPI